MSWKNIIKNEAQPNGEGIYKDADVHDAVDAARKGDMSKYDSLPFKNCTPTSGHQLWNPSIKDGEVVCLAHQARCPNPDNTNLNKADDVHDAVEKARKGDMSAYNALPLLDCKPESGHQIWQPNVKKGEATCIAHQSRCKITW